MAILPLAFVLLDEHQGDIQQRHIHIRLGFLAMGNDPHLSVLLLNNLFLGELLQIDVGKPGIAAEDEHVPDSLQPPGSELLVVNDLKFLLGEVTAVYRIKVHSDLSKRVSLHPAVVPAHLEDGGQLLHKFHRCVVGVVVLRSEPKVELVEKAFVYIIQRYIFHPVFLGYKFQNSVLTDVVAE